ncbi:MAG: hypothetical protein JXO72_07170 [Vicinamibacteria bacterium]|nr:hypothetical protein [Vicinamibacteria bacterium]
MNGKRYIVYAVSLTLPAIVGVGFAKPSKTTANAPVSSSMLRVENKALHINGLKSNGTYIVLAKSGSKISGVMLSPGIRSIEIPLSGGGAESPTYDLVELRLVTSTRCQPSAACPIVSCPGCAFDLRPSGGRLP